MKRSIALKICSVLMVTAMAFSIAACGKDEEKKEKKAEETTPSTEATTPAPTTTAPTIPTYSGPMVNDTSISWQEEEIQGGQIVKYVTCTDYINVRKGPGTEYDAVAKLSNNMQVIVVAVTSNNWYKTHDGFYVSGDLLAAAPSS